MRTEFVIYFSIFKKKKKKKKKTSGPRVKFVDSEKYF